MLCSTRVLCGGVATYEWLRLSVELDGAPAGWWLVSQQCHVDLKSLTDSYVYPCVENLGQIDLQNLGQIDLRAGKVRYDHTVLL